MLAKYYKDDLVIKTLFEAVDNKKILRKTYVEQDAVKCMFVTLSQGKVFQNEKDTVTSNSMCYCDTSVSVKMRDQAVVNSVNYEVVGVLTDVKDHHKEIYFVQI
jgi:hypothetical protein